jgi:hypothetical protein
MRSVTNPLFPAQVEGAVTLQALIDAREGNRLPLELALYVSGEVGKQVAQLQAIGREGSLDPKRVWCTSKGAVTVHEAKGGESRSLGPLVYQLLSGAEDVSAWPPSYFNPSVAESLDAAVMSAVNPDGPSDTRAMVEALNAATQELDQEASVAGMARLVFAVPDEPKAELAAPVEKPAPRLAPPPIQPPADDEPVRRAPRPTARLIAAMVIFLAGIGGYALTGSTTMKLAPISDPVVVPAAPVASPSQKPADPIRVQKAVKTWTAKATASRKPKTK